MPYLVSYQGERYHLPAAKSREALELIKVLLAAPARQEAPAFGRKKPLVLCVDYYERTPDDIAEKIRYIAGKEVILLSVRGQEDKWVDVSPALRARVMGLLELARNDPQALADNLKDRNKGVRLTACETLETLASRPAVPPPAALVALRQALRDKDAEVRLRAASVVLLFDPKSKEALAIILSDLKSDNNEARRKASAILEDRAKLIGPVIIPALRAALADSEEDVRLDAIQALRELGPTTLAGVMPDLVVCLRDREWSVRMRAMYAIADVGAGAVGAVPRLIEALQDPNERVQVEAINTLGAIGPAARAAVPDLLQLMETPFFQAKVARAVLRIDPGNNKATQVLKDVGGEKENIP